MTTDKTLVTIRFKKEALLYDVANYAYVSADNVPLPAEAHARHSIADIIQDGNKDIVTRAMDLAFAKCAHFLYQFTAVPITEPVQADDMLEDTSEYVLKMNVPTTFAHVSMELVRQLVHNFLLYRALEEWAILTYREVLPIWRQKSEEAQEELQRIMNKRTGRVRRPLRPFQ